MVLTLHLAMFCGLQSKIVFQLIGEENNRTQKQTNVEKLAIPLRLLWLTRFRIPDRTNTQTHSIIDDWMCWPNYPIPDLSIWLAGRGQKATFFYRNLGMPQRGGGRGWWWGGTNNYQNTLKTVYIPFTVPSLKPIKNLYKPIQTY